MFCAHWLKQLKVVLLPFGVVMASGGVFNRLGGLADDWDNCAKIRERIRTVGQVVVQQPTEGEREAAGPISKTVANARFNSLALQPLLRKMRGEFASVPCIESLAEELRTVFASNGLNVARSVLSEQAWGIRYLFGCVKQLLYKPLPKKELWIRVRERTVRDNQGVGL